MMEPWDKEEIPKVTKEEIALAQHYWSMMPSVLNINQYPLFSNAALNPKRCGPTWANRDEGPKIPGMTVDPTDSMEEEEWEWNQKLELKKPHQRKKKRHHKKKKIAVVVPVVSVVAPVASGSKANATVNGKNGAPAMPNSGIQIPLVIETPPGSPTGFNYRRYNNM